LVVTPLSRRVGVSRRIESDRERRRLKEIVTRTRPADLGFIIRTAGQGASEADLEADVRYLTSVWDDIQTKRETTRAPSTLYSELALPLRVIRDFVNSKTKRIVIDDSQVYEQMNDFLTRFVADPKPELVHYQGALPIFDHFKIEASIDASLGKKIWLRSGGYLVIDQSEALTAIDVNTGKFVGRRDLEETVFRTNLEAIKEVAHQLRFRNIGGIIIIDLIDMESMDNRDKVYRALREHLRQDKARTNILKISELGLVEMTRKRTRENLVQLLCEPCQHCEGRGYVLSSESMAYKVLREIRKVLPRFSGRQIAITVNPRVAEFLLGHAHKACLELGKDLGREIEVRGRPGLHQEQFEVTALDQGPPVSISLQWLGDPSSDGEEKVEAGNGKAKDAEAKTKAADTKVDGVEAKTEATDTKAGGAKAKTEATDTKADGAEAKTKAADTKADGAKAKTKATDTKADGAKAKTKAADTKADGAEAKTKAADTKTDDSEAKTEAKAGEDSDPAGKKKAPARKRRPRKPRKKAPIRDRMPPEDSDADEASTANALSAGPISAESGVSLVSDPQLPVATQAEEVIAAEIPALEMVDVEAETPILPPPAKQEE
jgi:ribonuclease G